MRPATSAPCSPISFYSAKFSRSERVLRPASTLRNVGIRKNAFENPDDFIRTLATNALIGGGQRPSIRRYLVRPCAEHFSVDLGADLQRLCIRAAAKDHRTRWNAGDRTAIE